MAGFDAKQKQMLQHPARMAIYSYIKEKQRLGQNARTLRAITDHVREVPGEATCFYHLGRLERVGLVEKVQHKYFTDYRVVEL